ncbi:MAG: hypothetical protein WBQ75_04695 [Acetobacteraceae bacterium]
MVVYKEQRHKEIYKFLHDLRDNHVAHDNNFYYQQQVVVGLDKDENVLDVTTVVSISHFNDQLLHLTSEVIPIALRFVEQAILKSGEKLAQEVQLMSVIERSQLGAWKAEGNTFDPDSRRDSDSRGDEERVKVPSILMRFGSVKYVMHQDIRSVWIKAEMITAFDTTCGQPGAVSDPR